MAVVGPARPRFLLLVPVCVGLGAACVIWEGHAINYLHLFLAFIGALSAHISVNALNEYDDYKSGLDFRTQRTPFSGGTGTLPSLPSRMSRVALITGLISLGLTVLVGVYFTLVRGIWILPLGIAGVLTIVLYTPVVTRFPALCLAAPGLGFGTLMVTGTYFALTGSYSWTSFVSSLVPFFLVSNLLLLNQFPDVSADKTIGRRHIPILWGNPKSAILLGLFYLFAYLTVVVGYFAGLLPIHSFIALIPAVLAVPTAIGSYLHADDIPSLVPHMGANVIITLVTPLLLAIGIIVAAL
ncbi:MAG: prenyltransferase [Deltaproteobacteria bacterium]|nr:prenyltransferase [Deltaproteobacteria bacterium]